MTRLSQYLSKPQNVHLNLAKFVLKYIKGTLNYKLTFRKSAKGLSLTAYRDSDWGSSDDRRSISGYCFFLHNDGPLISWWSKKQGIVALSSCEAEYIALAMTVQEAKFLRQLLADMTGDKPKNVNVLADNTGAIELSRNPVYHQRSKHIAIRYHFLRSEVQSQNITVSYVPSEQNYTDMFTKPLSKQRLASFESIRD